MKKIFFIICLLGLLAPIVQAQADYKVVFDLTSRDTLDHKAVLRWAGEVAKASADAKIEVVMYGQGVNMMVSGKSVVEETITKLMNYKNVSFTVCAVALKAQGIDKNQLIPGTVIVPDGIYEIISKQREGWGYIKAVH
ncbi:MAG TPA: DsrE family protein [Chitinophagaceae bacterium]|nr:DsrE family protein [Chitinophagaceae bacterium]